MRKMIGALLALALCAAVSSAAAAGSEWRTAQLPGEASKVAIFGVSCPLAQLCVAVGGNNTVASSINPRSSAPTWQVVYAGKGAIPTGPKQSIAFRQVRGVSCPSSGLCVAGTFEGDIYTATEPTGEATAWAVTDIDGEGPNTHIYGVSCPTTALCVAAAGGGKIVTSTDPTGGSAAWTTIQLAPSLELRGVSCASPSFCVAVGNEGLILASTSPTGGPASWAQVVPAVGNGNLFGVSCFAPVCVSGNTGGNLITSADPLGAPSSWKAVAGGGSVQITGASCVSATRCVVVDNNGDVLTSTDPTGGTGAWTFTNVLPFPGIDGTTANHFFGVSCPSVTLCGVAANDGQIVTSTNPFDADPISTPRKRRPPRKGPKRPRVQIAGGPRGILIARHGKVSAQFRFFAKNHAPVRGFVCRLDGRQVKRCRSPKRYHVGPGWHRIRIRAIGSTGLRGPVAKALFRVYAPAEWPPRGGPGKTTQTGG